MPPSKKTIFVSIASCCGELLWLTVRSAWTATRRLWSDPAHRGCSNTGAGSTVVLSSRVHPPLVDPKIAEFVYVILMTVVGVWLITWSVLTIARAVRTGVMPGRGVLYPRSEKPRMYWVGMLSHIVFILLGFVFLVAALFQVHKWMQGLNI